MTEAFHIIKAARDTPVFIFGDHASKHIPDEFDNLGLNGDDLTRHIAWDIGSQTVIEHLCEHFGCAAQLAGVSRLVIDINRDPSAKGLIPEESDGTIIPGNANLSKAERQYRMDRFYTPYHDALGQTLDTLSNPFVLSIHSFTPKPDLGEQRPTDIGLLVKHDEESAKRFGEICQQQNCHFTLGMNKPYSAYDLNYTVDEHVGPRGLRHLAIEIRQDHINTDNKARTMAGLLADRLDPFINRKA